MTQTHELKYTPTALELLDQINDTDGKVEAKVKQLRNHPRSRGKRLNTPLSHLHSAKAGAYRIIYLVKEEVVFIYGAGLRKEGDRDDIYNVIKREYGIS